MVKNIVHATIRAVSSGEGMASANRVAEQCGRSVLTYKIADRTSKAVYERASGDDEGVLDMM